MQPLYITNPTLLTPIQWREVAKEPITALCIRHIIREMVALDWEIVPEKPDKQEEQVKYFTRVLQEADDGDGWDVWLTRMLLDALELPIAGNAEMSPDDVSGLLGGLYHIDGATLFPTYDTSIPFVQINPYNGLDRVYFERGEMFRLLLQPRPDLVRKMYQTAPLESAFPSIEALSRIYLYYMKQLGDTPMVGILDLMDMSSDEAEDWALNFREMLNGIDPLKIPILYDHVKPAKFIPFSRSPQDLNIIETFKRYAEVVAAAFGLSIGDLRLFEHERTLAGVEASQRVTNRAGIGFYAQAIEDGVNRQILRDYESKMKFKFKQGATGEDLQEATLAQARATVIMTLTGNQPVLKPEDAQKVMQAWKMLPIEDLTGLPAAPGLAGLEGLGGGFPADNLSSIDQDTEAVGELATEETKPSALDTIDQVAAELGVKSVVKALLGDNLPQQLEKRRSITTGQFERLLAASFRQVGRGVTVDKIQSLLDKALTGTEKSLVGIESEDELMMEAVLKANDTAAQKLDDILAQEDWWQMPDIVGELSGILKQAYEEGAFQSAYHLQQQGYAQGATNQQTPQGFDFTLTNDRVLFLIENYSAELVQNVDQGTKYFLRQKILSGAKQGMSSRDIAADIAQELFKLKPSQASKLSDTRIRSIVNTELNWADSRAMFDMMVATGLKTKGWITRGDSDVCDLCRGNEDLGFVELDYEYGTVFGDETTLHPPAHPSTCHCYLQSNPAELSSFFESGVGFWNGGDEPALEQAVEDETARIISANQAAQKSSSRPGLDKDSKTWQMLEKAGAVHMDILGVYRNVNNGKIFLDVGDWVSDVTLAAMRQVFGEDVDYDREIGGLPDDSGNWQLIEPEKKSLPYSLWGYPDLPGKKARFDNEGDAQHWLITFGLVPVISDASFDVKGAGFKEAGVIWHRDGYVEANVMSVDDLPEADIVSGVATIFGGRGLKSENVVKSQYGMMAALDVPPEIANLFGEKVERPHVTLAYFSEEVEGKPIRDVDVGAIRHALLDVTQSTIPFVVQLTGQVVPMGSGVEAIDAAEVKINPEIKQLRDDFVAALHRYGYPSDATWGEFKPHVSIGSHASANGAALGLNESIMNANWFVTGIAFYVGGQRTFWPFKGAPVRDVGYYKTLVVDTWLARVPDHYRFEFQQFVKSRSKQDDLSNVSDEDMRRYYDDFMHSVFAFGFEYYKGADEYPPLVRSAIKDKTWQAPDAPGMVKSYLGGDADVKGAIEWLWKHDYQVIPTMPKEGDNLQEAVGMDKTELLEMMKAMQESNKALLEGMAQVVKSQPQPSPVMFNVQLPDKVDLTGSQFVIQSDALKPPDMTPVADAIREVGEIVRPQQLDMQPVANAIEKAMSKPDTSPTVINQAPDMSGVADAIRGVGEQLSKQKAPQVNVTMPTQASPTIVNKISVPPAQVTVEQTKRGKTKTKVIRNKDGDVVGIERDDENQS